MPTEIDAAYKAALRAVEQLRETVNVKCAKAAEEIQRCLDHPCEENMRLAESQANTLRDQAIALRAQVSELTEDRDFWQKRARDLEADRDAWKREAQGGLSA